MAASLVCHFSLSCYWLVFKIELNFEKEIHQIKQIHLKKSSRDQFRGHSLSIIIYNI